MIETLVIIWGVVFGAGVAVKGGAKAVRLSGSLAHRLLGALDEALPLGGYHPPFWFTRRLFETERSWIGRFQAAYPRPYNCGQRKITPTVDTLPGCHYRPPMIETFNNIRPGDRVHYLQANGLGRHGQEYKKASGIARICLPTHVILNIGGAHGTPAFVGPDNYLSHRHIVEPGEN